MPEIHHLALRTLDLPRLVRFYVEVLGFDVVRSREGAAWLGLGARAVLMIETASAQEPPIPRGSLELVAFRVDGPLAEVRERFHGHGVPVEGETAHTIYVRDPDGRRVGVSNHPLTEGPTGS